MFCLFSLIFQQALVNITSTTGKVYPVNVLDREKLQRFQLTLVVEDKNNVPNTKNNDTGKAFLNGNVFIFLQFYNFQLKYKGILNIRSIKVL